MQGPGPYLNDLGITLPCAVHPERAAVIDETHRIFVNYETYYVADGQALADFLASPTAYTGRVTDPVSRARFLPVSGSPRRERAGRIFLFESRETVRRFDADPERYATPMVSMDAPAAH